MAESIDTLTTVMKVVGFTEMIEAFRKSSEVVELFSRMEEGAATRAEVLTAAQEAVAASHAAVMAATEAAAAATADLGAGSLAAASAMTELSLAEDVAADAALALAAAEDTALPPLLLLTIAIAAFIAAVATAGEAVHVFAHESEQLFRVQMLLKNLGDSVPLDKFREMAESVSRATGFMASDVESVSAQLLAAGIHGDQLQKVLMGAADAARTSGKSLTEIGEIIQKGDMGRAKGLFGLGIRGEDTGSIQGNQAQILAQIEKRSRGASEAFMTTLPGSIQNFSRAMEELFAKLGEQFAPAAIAALNAVAKMADWLSDHMEAVAGTIRVIATIFNPLAAGLNGLRGASGPAAGFGGEKLATENTLNKIAENTKTMPDLIKGIIGGTGAFKEQFATMSVQHAMMI